MELPMANGRMSIDEVFSRPLAIDRRHSTFQMA
jgi:hypothetical protein